MARFRGFLQADGYSGFGRLYETSNGAPATVTEVACWAHVRRKFYDIHVATNAPIAGDALARMGQLFDIERAAMGRSPQVRARIRQSAARPVIDGVRVARLVLWGSGVSGSLPAAASLGECNTR